MLSLSRARAPAPQGVLVDDDGTLLDLNATWGPADRAGAVSAPASPSSRGW